MASKRDLKRRINYICSDLFAECVAASLYGTSEYKETAEATLTSLLFMHRNYVRRISHPEPGMTKKAYYKDLISKFNTEIGEIIDQIASLQ